MYSSFLCLWLQRELQYLVYHIAKKHFPRSLMLQSNLSFPKHTKLIYTKSGNLFAIFFLSFTLWSNVILHRHFPGWPWRLSISVTNSLFITSLLYEIIVFIYLLPFSSDFYTTTRAGMFSVLFATVGAGSGCHCFNSKQVLVSQLAVWVSIWLYLSLLANKHCFMKFKCLCVYVCMW